MQPCKLKLWNSVPHLEQQIENKIYAEGYGPTHKQEQKHPRC